MGLHVPSYTGCQSPQQGSVVSRSRGQRRREPQIGQVQVAGRSLQPDTNRRRVNGTARPRGDNLLQRARTAHPSNNRRAPITAVPVPATERDSAARQCGVCNWHGVVLWQTGRHVFYLSTFFKLVSLLLEIYTYKIIDFCQQISLIA